MLFPDLLLIDLSCFLIELRTTFPCELAPPTLIINQEEAPQGLPTSEGIFSASAEVTSSKMTLASAQLM